MIDSAASILPRASASNAAGRLGNLVPPLTALRFLYTSSINLQPSQVVQCVLRTACRAADV
jgi:hypothetical protein